MLRLSLSSVPGDPATKKNRQMVSLCHLFVLSFLIVCCRAVLPESSSNNSDSVVSGDGREDGSPISPFELPLGSSGIASSSDAGLFSAPCHGEICAATARGGLAGASRGDLLSQPSDVIINIIHSFLRHPFRGLWKELFDLFMVERGDGEDHDGSKLHSLVMSGIVLDTLRWPRSTPDPERDMALNREDLRRRQLGEDWYPEDILAARGERLYRLETKKFFAENEVRGLVNELVNFLSEIEKQDWLKIDPGWDDISVVVGRLIYFKCCFVVSGNGLTVKTKT